MNNWEAIARVLAEWLAEEDDRSGLTDEQLLDLARVEAARRASAESDEAA